MYLFLHIGIGLQKATLFSTKIFFKEFIKFPKKNHTQAKIHIQKPKYIDTANVVAIIITPDR